MTYVTDQTSEELRAHMRRLRRMAGWHEPLADRLFKEIVALDAELARLLSELDATRAQRDRLMDALVRIDEMDYWHTRADDLGQACRIASQAISREVGHG